MTALAAVAKHLLKAFVANPKGILKILAVVVMIPIIMLLLLIAGPLALFTHVPLIEEEEQALYQEVIKEIKNETGIEININELLGIDAVILQQEFHKANKSDVKKLAWEFIEERMEKRTRTVSVPCEDDSSKICEKEEEYEVLVYYLYPFDTVLSNLVSKGIIESSWIEDIKRYAAVSTDNDTKVDIDNLPVVTDGTFMRPATGRITSGRGPRWGRMHQGVDIGGGGRSGVPIVASAEGVVSRSQVLGGFGEVVMIKHNINGQLIETVYAHIVRGTRKVSVGQTVSKGEVIGIMGTTGDSTGVHLHFEFHIGPWNASSTNAVDPLLYVPF